MTDLPPPVLVGRPLKVGLVHTAAWLIIIQAVLQGVGFLLLLTTHP